MRNPCRREAYPSDIFYVHARLLKRSAQMSWYYGHSSLTALPVIEVCNDDITTYIPTNLISITDRQWFLDSKVMLKRLFPALNMERSVSRVRKKAQSELMD
jgi:F-type H+-transporting ATPase subunit alpha